MSDIWAWIVTQLNSATTHIVIAGIFAVLMQDHVIPQPYAAILTVVFAALGIVIPEAGEKK